MFNRMFNIDTADSQNVYRNLLYGYNNSLHDKDVRMDMVCNFIADNTNLNYRRYGLKTKHGKRNNRNS